MSKPVFLCRVTRSDGYTSCLGVCAWHGERGVLCCDCDACRNRRDDQIPEAIRRAFPLSWLDTLALDVLWSQATTGADVEAIDAYFLGLCLAPAQAEPVDLLATLLREVRDLRAIVDGMADRLTSVDRAVHAPRAGTLRLEGA